MYPLAIRVVATMLCLLAINLPLTAENGADDASREQSANIQSAAAALPSAANTGVASVDDSLVRLLVGKGILSASDAESLNAAPATEKRDRLLLLLETKGVLSAQEIASLSAARPAVSGSGPRLLPAVAVVDSPAAAETQSSQAAPSPSAGSSGPVAAVAPLRVLPINPPKREGVIPAFSIGKIRVAPYGLFKASVIYDSQSPYGNDFPLPGFIGDVNGPDGLPEFHVKARYLRLGSNFEWPDLSPDLVLSGKFEYDFEGDFTRVSNRNLSSVRSSQASIRVAYARLDWRTTDKTTLNFLGGQDWTPFASSTLPSLFETTGIGGLDFGTLWERAPQFRFGLNHKFSGSLQIEPDFAVVLPAFGNTPSDVANQLAFGERQGADSGRPEIQARLVTQFQLDHAPNVPPAQIIFSGVQAERSAVVLASGVPAAFKTAFPSGTRIHSDLYGWTAEVQLPTRFATLNAKYYNGKDLRFHFGGLLLSEFNDTFGLTGTATAPSIDGSSTLVFGLRNGVPAVAGQHGPRAQGGFLELALPLSRWANAKPDGRNAGWVMYLHYGYDQVLARDARRLGGGRQKADLFAGTLQYKLNNWIAFIAEESLYRTRAIQLTSTGSFPLFAGKPTREMKDFRSEFGPVFTF